MSSDSVFPRTVPLCLRFPPDALGDAGDELTGGVIGALGKPYCARKDEGAATVVNGKRVTPPVRWKVYLEDSQNRRTMNIPRPALRKERVVIGKARRNIYTLFDPMEDCEFYTGVTDMDVMSQAELNRLVWNRWVPNHPFKVYDRWVTFHGTELVVNKTLYLMDEKMVNRLTWNNASVVLYPERFLNTDGGGGGDDADRWADRDDADGGGGGDDAGRPTTVHAMACDGNTVFVAELTVDLVHRLNLDFAALKRGDLHVFLPEGLPWFMAYPISMAEAAKDKRYVAIREKLPGDKTLEQDCMVDTNTRTISLWDPVKSEWGLYAPTLPSTVTIFLGEKLRPWDRLDVRWKKTPRYNVPMWRDPLTRGLYEIVSTDVYDRANRQFISLERYAVEAVESWREFHTPAQEHYFEHLPWAARIRAVCRWVNTIEQTLITNMLWEMAIDGYILEHEQVIRLTSSLWAFMGDGLDTIVTALTKGWPSRYAAKNVARMKGNPIFAKHCGAVAEQLKYFGEVVRDRFQHMFKFKDGVVADSPNSVHLLHEVDNSGFFAWKHVDDERPVWVPDRMKWVLPAVYGEDEAIVDDKRVAVRTELVFDEVDLTPRDKRDKGWDLTPRAWYVGEDRVAWLDWATWHKYVFDRPSDANPNPVWTMVRTEVENDRHSYVQFSDWLFEKQRGNKESMRTAIVERDLRYTRKVSVRGTGFISPNIHLWPLNMNEQPPGTVFWPIGEDMARNFFGLKVSEAVGLQIETLKDPRRDHAIMVLEAQRHVEQLTRSAMTGETLLLEDGRRNDQLAVVPRRVGAHWMSAYLGGKSSRYDRGDDDGGKMRRGKDRTQEYREYYPQNYAEAKRQVGPVDETPQASRGGAADRVELANPAVLNESSRFSYYDIMECSNVRTGVSIVDCVLDMLCMFRESEAFKVPDTGPAVFARRWIQMMQEFNMRCRQDERWESGMPEGGFRQLRIFYEECVRTGVIVEPTEYHRYVRQSLAGVENTVKRGGKEVVKPADEILAVLGYYLGININCFEGKVNSQGREPVVVLSRIHTSVPKNYGIVNERMPKAFRFTDEQTAMIQSHRQPAINLLFPGEDGGACRLLLPLTFIEGLIGWGVNPSAPSGRQEGAAGGNVTEYQGTYDANERTRQSKQETSARVLASNNLLFDMFLRKQRLGNYSFFGCIRDAAAACLNIDPAKLPSVYMMMRDWFKWLCTYDEERNKRLIDNGVEMVLDTPTNGSKGAYVNTRAASPQAVQNAIQNIVLGMMGPLASGAPLTIEPGWMLPLCVLGVPRSALQLGTKGDKTWHPLCFYPCREVSNRLEKSVDKPVVHGLRQRGKMRGDTLHVPFLVMTTYGLVVDGVGAITNRPVESVTYHLLCVDKPVSVIGAVPEETNDQEDAPPTPRAAPPRAAKEDGDEYDGKVEDIVEEDTRGRPDRFAEVSAKFMGPRAIMAPETNTVALVSDHIGTLNLLGLTHLATRYHVEDMGNSGTDVVLPLTVTREHLMAPTVREQVKNAVSDTMGFPLFAYFIRNEVVARYLYLDDVPANVVSRYDRGMRSEMDMWISNDVFVMDTFHHRFRLEDVPLPFEQPYHRLDLTRLDPLAPLVVRGASFDVGGVGAVPAVTRIGGRADGARKCLQELKQRWSDADRGKPRGLLDALAFCRGLAAPAHGLGVPPGEDGGVLTVVHQARATIAQPEVDLPLVVGMVPVFQPDTHVRSTVPAIENTRGIKNVVEVNPSVYSLMPPTDPVLNLFLRNLCFHAATWPLNKVAHVWCRSFDKKGVESDDGEIKEEQDVYREGMRYSGISMGRLKQTLLEGIESNYGMAGLPSRDAVLTYAVLEALAGVYDSTNEAAVGASVLDRAVSYPNFIVVRACGDAFGQYEVVLHSDIRGLSLAWHLLQHPELTPAFVVPRERWHKEDHEQNLACLRRDMLSQVAVILHSGVNFFLLRGGSVVNRAIDLAVTGKVGVQPLRSALGELLENYVVSSAGLDYFERGLPVRPRLRIKKGGSKKRYRTVPGEGGSVALDTEVEFVQVDKDGDYWDFKTGAGLDIRRVAVDVRKGDGFLRTLKEIVSEYADKNKIRVVVLVAVGPPSDGVGDVQQISTFDYRISRKSAASVRGQSFETEKRVNDVVNRVLHPPAAAPAPPAVVVPVVPSLLLLPAPPADTENAGVQALIHPDDYKQNVLERGSVTMRKLMMHETVYVVYDKDSGMVTHVVPVERMDEYNSVEDAQADAGLFRAFYKRMKEGIKDGLGVIESFSRMLKCLTVFPEYVNMKVDMKIGSKGTTVKRPINLPTTLEADMWRQHYNAFFKELMHNFNPKDKEFPMSQYDEYAENLSIFFFYVSMCCGHVKKVVEGNIKPFLRSVYSMMVQRSIEHNVQVVLREVMAISTFNVGVTCLTELKDRKLLRSQEEIYEKFLVESAGVKTVVHVTVAKGNPPGFERFVKVMRPHSSRFTFVDREKGVTSLWDPVARETREILPVFPFVSGAGASGDPLGLKDLCVVSNSEEYRDLLANIAVAIDFLRVVPDNVKYQKSLADLNKRMDRVLLRIRVGTGGDRGLFTEFVGAGNSNGLAVLEVRVKELENSIEEDTKLMAKMEELQLVSQLEEGEELLFNSSVHEGARLTSEAIEAIRIRISEARVGIQLVRQQQADESINEELLRQGGVAKLEQGGVAFDAISNEYTWHSPVDGFTYILSGDKLGELRFEDADKLWVLREFFPAWNAEAKTWSDTVMYDPIMDRHVWRNSYVQWFECRPPLSNARWRLLSDDAFPGLFFPMAWDATMDDVISVVSLRCSMDPNDIAGSTGRNSLRDSPYVYSDDGKVTYKTIDVEIKCTNRKVWRDNKRADDEDDGRTPWQKEEKKAAFEQRELQRTSRKQQVPTGVQQPHWSEAAAQKNSERKEAFAHLNDTNYVGMRCLETYNGYCNCISTDFGSVELRREKFVNPFTEWRQSWFVLSTDDQGRAKDMCVMHRVKLNPRCLNYDNLNMLAGFLTNAEGLNSFRYVNTFRNISCGDEVYWAHDMAPVIGNRRIRVSAKFDGALKQDETLVQLADGTQNIAFLGPVFPETIRDRTRLLAKWVMDPLNWYWDPTDRRFRVFLFGPDLVNVQLLDKTGDFPVLKDFLVQEMQTYYVDQFVPSSRHYDRYYAFLGTFTKERAVSRKAWEDIEKQQDTRVSPALMTKILLDLRGKLPSDARSPHDEWVPKRPDQRDLEKLDAIHIQWREKYILAGAGPCKYYYENAERIRTAMKLPATGEVSHSILMKARVNRQKEVRAKFLELFALKFGVGFGSYMDDERVRSSIDEWCPGFVGPCSGYREFVSKKRKAHDIVKFYSVWYDAMEQNRGTYAEFCSSYFSPDHSTYDGKDIDTPTLFAYVSRVSINSRAPAIRSRFATEVSR